MSNFLAIATVTAALSETLQAAVATDVPGASVTVTRPGGNGDGTPAAGVKLFLYQVTPNPTWRNADLPTRRSGGEVLQRPRAALDLHYLLTFHGDDTRLEPQRILGSVVRALHARPILTREAIRQTVANPTFHFLADSDLAADVELVRFTPLALSLEELSKLWSVFFQTPYALSVAYQGTVVLIEAHETPQTALPVRQPSISVVTFAEPRLESVESAAGAGEPVVAGSTLVLRGQRLRADITTVRVGEVELAPAAVADTEISVELDDPGLRAGVQGIRVRQGTGAESNTVRVTLRPAILSVTITNVEGSGTDLRAADLTLEVKPVVGAGQRIVLLLNEPATDAARAFSAAPLAADAGTVTIPISGVRAGAYLVRLEVDGAASPLAVDTDPLSPAVGRYATPAVTVP